jgi:kinesin family protein 11
MRPGTRTAVPSRLTGTRHASVASRLARAESPAESLISVATAATSGAKRKERDFDLDDGEATNINVVVRCRGRNEREVRENSAVVVRTDGTKGKLVELSMGPNAVSNKTYNFDRVFSQAADQSMIFEDVVKPVLDEVNLPMGRSKYLALTHPDAGGLQLHHLRVRTDGDGQDVHHVG